MKPKVITPPTEEPVTLAEARAHLEAPSYGDSDADPVDDVDDLMILGWLAAAREHCENFLGLSLSPRVLEIALDKFPTKRCDGRAYIELPMGPVVGVLSVTYGVTPAESDDTDTETMDAADYTFDDFAFVPRLVPVTSWPIVTAATNNIRIRYSAGYEIDTDGVSAIPAAIRAAILLILGHLYKNREDSTEKALAAIPNGAEALMRPLRVLTGMA